jgi:hypothetical protein
VLNGNAQGKQKYVRKALLDDDGTIYKPQGLPIIIKTKQVKRRINTLPSVQMED